jgi:DNA-binding transcriptional LysR family regulator
MNIRFLETAIWLAELRNFRITAERMNMTPAAISNRITAMEQELGFKLFDRDARDVRGWCMRNRRPLQRIDRKSDAGWDT